MFYDRFKGLCDLRGISVTRATTEIGLSRTIGTKWKNTKATPQGETLNKIAEYFNVTVDYLLSGDEGNSKSPAAEAGGEQNTIVMIGRNGARITKKLSSEDMAFFEKMLDRAVTTDEDL